MPAPTKSLPRLLALALLALGGLSCVDGPTGLIPQGSVTVTPEAISLRPLDTARLTVVVRAVDGTLIPVPIVDWRALDTTIATVDSTGLVTAASYTGPAIRNTKLVVGSLGARSDTVPVEVLPFPVARVRTLVDTVTLRPRDTLTVGVRAESEAGVELTNRPTVWISSDTIALETRSDGRLRAKPYLGPTTRTVFGVVFSEGKADSVVVVITPMPIATLTAQPDSVVLLPGQLDTLAVIARTAGGEQLEAPALTWRSTDTTVVRTNEEGILTGQFYVGTATRTAAIIVEAGSVADTIPVRVPPLSVARVTVTPDTAVVISGGAAILNANLFDAGGLLLEGRPITWSSTNAIVATVDSTGRVTAAAYGGTAVRSAQIIAASGGRADTTQVQVVPHEPAWVVADPEAVSLQPGDTANVAAALFSLDLTPLLGRSTQWRSLDTTVATVELNGSNTARIVARAYSGPLRRTTSVIVSHTLSTSFVKADTIPVEVLPLVTARVEASVDSVVLTPRDSSALVATPRTAEGLALTGRTITWIAEDTTVASVSASGVVRARNYVGPLERRTNVIVFADGSADTVVAIVKPFVPTSISVAPDSLTLTPGSLGEFSSLLRSTFGDTLREFSIAWQSADTTVARVNAAGVVTASFYAGSDVRSTRVTASLGSVVDTGVVVVNPLSVARVTISPDSGTLRPGATFQLDAALRDAENLLLTGRAIAWSALDTARASIDASGLVTASVYGGADVRTARFVASAGGAADTVTLTIAPHDVRFIAATPEALSLSPLDSAALSAELLSIDLTVLSGRAVQFASLDTNVVRVSPAGIATATLYTGPSTRTSAILVTSGAAVDTVPVAVTPFAVASVVATPATVSLAVGDSAALALRLASAGDITLTGREIAWVVSDTTMLAVSANGVVRAKPYDGPLTRTAQVIVFAEGLADTVAVTVTPRAAATVSLTPASFTLRPGEVDTLVARVETATGDELVDFPITWTSSDTTVAFVNAAGVVTASYYVGAVTRTARIIASTGSIADTSVVEVLPLSVASLALTPDTASLLPGNELQLDVIVRDAAALQLTDRVITYASDALSVATVNATGRVTVLASGRPDTVVVRITATSEGRADTTTITVRPHPVAWVTATPEAIALFPLGMDTLTATQQSFDLTPLTGRSVSYTALDASVATVTPTGVVTATAYTGPATRTTSILVTSEGIADTVPVSVSPLAAARVIATPSADTITLRDSLVIAARSESADGTTLTGREFAWISGDTALFSISASGVVRPRPYAGPLTRSAVAVVFSEGFADSVLVTVLPDAPTELTVTPSTLSLLPGAVDTASTTVRNALGETLSAYPVTWTTADTTIALVNAEGIITAAFYAGADSRSVAIVAALNALRDTTIVTVTPYSVAAVAIVPDTGSLFPGATFQLDATVRNADDALLSGRAIAWSSLDPAIGTVNSSGLVSAIASGRVDSATVRIAATVEGVADTITLVVRPHPVAWVSATPEALSLSPLDTATLTPSFLSLDLTPLVGRSASFSTLDTTVVRITAGGLATASAYTGPATRTSALLVTSGSAVDTVPVTVVPLAVQTVVATPSAVTLGIGDSTTLALRLASATDITLTDREVLWQSSDTAVVSVSGTGVVRARPYNGPLTRTAQVVVFAEGRADTVSVTVSPLAPTSIALSPASLALKPGQADTLAARVETAGGDELVAFPITYTSTDTTVAIVNVEGIVTASFYVGAATRSAQIIASTGALADTITVEVTPLAVATLALAPDTASLLPGNELQLDVVVRDAAALQLADRVIAYASDAMSIATVNAAGRVTVVPSGRPDTVMVRISATSEGRADTTTITVLPHPVAWVTATPEAITLLPLGVDTLTATQQSFDLTPLTGRSVSYSTLDASVATVTPSGIVTAAAYTGAATRTTSILVTSEGIADTVPVSVSPLAAARVIATPSAVTLTLADTAVLASRTESLDGTTLTGRAFLWVSGDTAMFTVDTAGVVRPRPYNGPLTRTAFAVVFSEGFADSVEVTITPDAAAELIVAPAEIDLLPGSVDTASVVVRTAGGDTLSGFPVTWTSADPAIATVNVEGIITAMFYAGADTLEVPVIAALNALRDTTTVRVLPYDVASVAITPDTGSLLPSATFQLDATVRNADAVFLTGRTVTWTSLDAAIATVNSAGLVTAVASGRIDTVTARVVASVGSVADTITLVVRPHEAAWVTATPEALSILPGDTVTVVPTVLSLGLTPLLSRSVTYSTLDAAVATVNAEGLVTATAFTGPALRNTSIIVTSGAAADTVPVEVRPLTVARVIAAADSLTLNATDSLALVASVESANGVTLSGRALLWLSSDTAIAQVTPDTQVVAARYLGVDTLSTTLVVYSEGLADTVVVTRLPRVPAAIDVPDTTTTFPGQQVTVSAVTLSAFGDTLTGHVVQWATRDAAIAQVNADGIVTGSFYAGPDIRETYVVATLGALKDSTLARIQPLLVDSVAIFPDTATLKPNRTWEPGAVLRDAEGTFLSGRTPTWTSSDTVVATVSTSGVVTTHQAGVASIIATSGTGADTATVTVVHPATSLTLTPSLATVWIGQTQALTLVIRDSADAVLTDRAVKWSSSDSSVATISSTGVITGLTQGLVTITATVEGLTASVSVDVFPEPSSAITITFDDAWRGVLTYAAPILDSLRLRANVGWITDVNWAGVMVPSELEQLQDRGWSILSHSMTHARLTDITLDSAAIELSGSRTRIATLGFDPRVFIAPYLAHNDDILAASAAAGYTYTRCCAQDVWTTDTLVSWPILPEARHRLAGVDVTDYDGEVTTYNFRTAEGRTALRTLLESVVAQGKFIDVFFHDIVEADVPDLRLTLEILADFRPYLITYQALP